MKLFVTEPGSADLETLWRDAEYVLMAEIGYAEIRAALAAARRSRRLSSRAFEAAKEQLGWSWAEIDVVNVDSPLIRAAGDIAEDYELRACDAVHLAAALTLGAESVVLASWDRDLRAAASSAGLHVAP